MTLDPRKSLQERYQTHEGYVTAVKHAPEQLVQERFLIGEDAQRYIHAAEASNILKQSTPGGGTDSAASPSFISATTAKTSI